MPSVSLLTPEALSNANSLWGAFVAEALHRLGVAHAVVSPGSRSTPLAFALGRHGKLRVTPVVDERSAAFFALGLARASRRPVVLVCTSGTAAANYFPAVIEARESHVPLLLLTADRPPELRQCRAGQTIDQVKLYGNYPLHQAELPLPEATAPALRQVRQTLQYALERARAHGGGPVHLNCPLRDPLAPGKGPGLSLDFDPAALLDGLVPPAVVELQEREAPQFAGRGLILAGWAQPEDPAAWATAVGRIAETLGWPVLADATNPLRHHAARVPYLISHYDLVLRSPEQARRLVPEQILCLGEPPTSKILRQWLEPLDLPTTVLADHLDNGDPLHARARHFRGSVCWLAEHVEPVARDPETFRNAWLLAEKTAGRALEAGLRRSPPNFEGRVARILADLLPKGTPLFVANSMPVRDLEWFWPAGNRQVRPFVNRGANGIDGTLSTALGLAEAMDRPAVLLTGDLALLHDTNGWLLAPRLRGSLTVVVINNQGGGIFEHLAIAHQNRSLFEDLWATPQEVDFAHLARAHGVDYLLLKSIEELAEPINSLPRRGLRLVELRTDRRADAATRKALFASVVAGRR